MARRYWLPTITAELLLMVQNFDAKIDSYAVPLGLAPAEITAAHAICAAILGSINSAEQCKSTMQAMIQWRDDVLHGEPFGTPAPAAPVFPVVGAVTYDRGVIKEFVNLRDQIVNSA